MFLLRSRNPQGGGIRPGRRLGRAGACLALLLVTAQLPAIAEARTGRAAARRHYRRAVRLYDAARYQASYDEMKRAYALDPVPGLLFNLAQVAERLDHRDEAAGHLEAYLRAEPDAPDAREVRARIDGLRRPAVTLGPPRLAAGTAPTGPVLGPEVGGAGGQAPPWPPLLLLGGGAVVLTTGIGLGIGALGLAQAEGEGPRGSGRAMSVSALVLDIVGAAALGAGAIWTAGWAARARAPSVALVPAGAGAVVVGRF